MKFNLAVVGTNFIVPTFIEAAERSGYFHLHSIVSRKTETGIKFRQTNGYQEDVVIYDHIDKMLNDDTIDAVYIASPNATHFTQASACINAGKAIFIEKPITSNTKELHKLIELANLNNVLLVDGMKSLVSPNFIQLADNLHRVGRIRACSATYSKVSSRYQQYLDGNNPNTFNPKLSNGSAMDLGVYCLYPFVHLFGTPKEIHAYADLLDSGVDAAGAVILKYSDYHVSITHSKTCASTNSSEIQGEQGTIVISDISTFANLMFVDNNGLETDISTQQDPNSLLYIARHFGEAMSTGLKESPVNTHVLSTSVMNILDSIRRQTGVIFPADKQ